MFGVSCWVLGGCVERGVYGAQRNLRSEHIEGAEGGKFLAGPPPEYIVSGGYSIEAAGGTIEGPPRSKLFRQISLIRSPFNPICSNPFPFSFYPICLQSNLFTIHRL